MEMAAVVFPETYGNIISREQIKFMMDMMYSEINLRHQMTTAGNIFFICDGKGYVSFRYVERMEDGVDLFHLEKLYVMPEAQGKGLGRELFETVVKAAKASSVGGTRIELNVNRNNKAISFYKHLGMKIARQGDFPIGKGFFMNDYIMSIDC